MLLKIGKLVVIQPCPLEPSIIQLKAQGMDQMESGPGIGAEPDNIAGIRRNLRLYQNDIKHPLREPP